MGVTEVNISPNVCVALGETLRSARPIVEPLRKEVKYLVTEQAYAIDGVRPVNQQSAPDHQEQEREVDPVQPTYRQQMLLL